MKKSLLAVFVAVLVSSITMTGWGRDIIKASKNYVTVPVKVGSFTGINTISSIDVEYTQGPLKVELYSPDNLVKYVEIKVKNGTLTARYTGDCSIRGNAKTKVIVSAPNVNGFTTRASGDIKITSPYTTKGNVSFSTQASGDIEAISVEAGNVSLAAQASGDIKVTYVKASKVEALTQGSGDISIIRADVPSVTMTTQASGDIDFLQLTATDIDAQTQASGDITVRGRCVNAKYRSLGSGDINAGEMKAEAVTVNTSGSGDINCYASKIATGGEHGSGDIKVSGHPAQYSVTKRR